MFLSLLLTCYRYAKLSRPVGRPVIGRLVVRSLTPPAGDTERLIGVWLIVWKVSAPDELVVPCKVVSAASVWMGEYFLLVV